ncbi:MAG: hypothetical protein EOP85_01895 [Verrucomicrobiaceae bacterium]|nr:MAG: hypothetical protein EOP85_01895 [Verrucomicrobiaceae bacterium]
MFAQVEAKASGDPGKSDELILAALDLTKLGKIDPNNLSIILQGTYAADPFKKWGILEGAGNGLPPAVADRILSETVPDLITADLEKAMKIVTTSAASRYSVPVLSSAITTMYRNDPNQANEWLTENLPKIDPATRQRMTEQVAYTAIKNGEFQTARQWAEQLLNPDVRKRALDRIETAESSK